MSVLTNARYNFTLCNLYQTGNNHISYHSDDERFLGARACCSLRGGQPSPIGWQRRHNVVVLSLHNPEYIMGRPLCSKDITSP